MRLRARLRYTMPLQRVRGFAQLCHCCAMPHVAQPCLSVAAQYMSQRCNSVADLRSTLLIVAFAKPCIARPSVALAHLCGQCSAKQCLCSTVPSAAPRCYAFAVLCVSVLCLCTTPRSPALLCICYARRNGTTRGFAFAALRTASRLGALPLPCCAMPSVATPLLFCCQSVRVPPVPAIPPLPHAAQAAVIQPFAQGLLGHILAQHVHRKSQRRADGCGLRPR